MKYGAMDLITDAEMVLEAFVVVPRAIVHFTSTTRFKANIPPMQQASTDLTRPLYPAMALLTAAKLPRRPVRGRVSAHCQ